MLKRSKLLVAFLLVTVICASVGFANIADDLFVEGTMGINVSENSPADEEFEGDVYFVDGSTSVVLSNGTGTVTATVTDQSDTEVDDKITLDIPDTAWAKIGDTVTLTVKVKNENTSIGKRYEAEKVIGYRRNASGWNQYIASDDTPSIDRYRPANMRERDGSPGRRTAEKLGSEYHLSHSTVEKYGAYSKAIDTLAQKEPSLPPLILTGKYRISHDNLVDLSKQSRVEIGRFIRRMEGQESPSQFVPYSKTRSGLQSAQKPIVVEVAQPSIKDMPEYDPDSDITGLTLTIPSWASSITRTKNKANLSVISDTARANLENALCELQETINEMLDAIKED